MRKVTYEMSMSLDGYVVGPDGAFDWGEPDEEIFGFFLDQLRGVGVHVLGRKLYETMTFWETVDPETLSEQQREWADLWNALPKVVFSRTLTEVHGAARLAAGDLRTEIERLRSEAGPDDVAIGGATLAAQVAALDLIDEYQVRVCPVLVGGGQPYFAHDGRHVDLDLVETRPFPAGSVFLRYRVRR